MAEQLKGEGNRFFKEGDYQNAIHKYNAAIKIDDTEATYHSNLSASYYKIQKYKEAQKSARRTIRLKSSTTVAILVKGYYRLALAIIAEGDEEGKLFTSEDDWVRARLYVKAMTVLRQASTIEPHNTDVKRMLREKEIFCENFCAKMGYDAMERKRFYHCTNADSESDNLSIESDDESDSDSDSESGDGCSDDSDSPPPLGNRCSGSSSDEEIPHLETRRGQGFKKKQKQKFKKETEGRAVNKKASKHRGSSDSEDSENENESDSDTETPPLDDNYISDSSTDGADSMPDLHDRAHCGSSSDDDSDYGSDSDPDMPALDSRNQDDDSSSSSGDDSDDSDEDASNVQQRLNQQQRQKRLNQQRRDEELRQKRAAAEQARQQKQMEEERQKQENAAKQKRKKEAEKRRKADAKRLRKSRNAKGAIINTFFKACIKRDIAMNEYAIMRRGWIRLQTVHRSNTLREQEREDLARRRRFYSAWNSVVKEMKDILNRSNIEPDWTSIRSEQRFIKRTDLDYDDDFTETNKLLEDAMNLATEEEMPSDDQPEGAPDSDDEDDGNVKDEKKMASCSKTGPGSDTLLGDHTKIRFTSDAVKWIKQGDAKYLSFFIKKMVRLSRGERSHKLAKPLVGPKNKTVYETYLENKSGQRILWTEEEGGNILVWYVAKHKSVSRLAGLIDDSESRSTKQRTDLTELPALAPGMLEEQNDKRESGDGIKDRSIILDPLGNVPLKVYEIPAYDLEQISNESWMPPMHLTEEEREIVVNVKGTVLLLGRSGTGKTVCICNRMEYDRTNQRLESDEFFSQLFIARSRRLCTFVSKTIGLSPVTAFSTFEEHLNLLENELPEVEGLRNRFPRLNRMDFNRFKLNVYNGDLGIDPLLVWTNIRSFIKGSIHSVESLPNHVVSNEDYVSSEVFQKVSRVQLEQLQTVYEIYTKYENYMNDNNLWDNCDRIMVLLQRLAFCRKKHPEIFATVRQTKVYVDEIQDYTQAEILLFFHLARGLGDLFLAGDPAQSVAEGIEFRFADIRSVAYHIVAGKNGEGKNIPGIPNKPKNVTVNFRSHAGILNTASDILSLMFKAFPESATELKEDKGIFSGPRPGVFQNVEAKLISNLLKEKMNGVVVLTHDSKVDEWVDKLNYKLVYGIRAAKGLEFKRVILLDFFSGLNSDMQKPWRELVLGRAQHDFKDKFPEVEGHLKLLYTAITRCIEQLFIAETTSTSAGDNFIRWITSTNVKNGVKQRSVALATRNNVLDVEKMKMTRDEWLAAGIEAAEAAEAEESNDLDNAERLLERAKYCFEEAKENERNLLHKADAHLQSIRFQSQLPMLDSSKGSTDSLFYEQIELKGSQIVIHLLSHDLLRAAQDLSNSIAPYMSEYSRERLEQEFMSVLDSKLKGFS